MPNLELLEQEIIRVFDLTPRDKKPLYGTLAHLTSEVGELAKAIEYHEGHLPRKQMKDPIIGEIADVIQCALSILAKVTPGIDNNVRIQMLANMLVVKTNKWENVLNFIDIVKA